MTLPLPAACVEALKAAADEMGRKESFMGYGPYEGYDFLREAIVKNDYATRGVKITADEIFVSDGAKSDCGNIGDIFGVDNVVAVCDPVYPVYVDTNAMAGRAGEYQAELGRWSKLVYMPCVEENGFTPQPPKEKVDIIYLCFPNNPTGETLTKAQLQEWVDYANREGCVIIFDAAYEAYISQEDIPHSIYECEGAQTCAIELRSFSKNAGFTGLRLAYTVVPKALKDQNGTSLNALWARRHGTKYNGAPYIVQRAGEAVYTPEGQAQVREMVGKYMKNASYILNGLKEAGYEVYGGVNSPYVWLRTPDQMTSWEFFDYLLENAHVVGTPGSGFGPSGEGYIRMPAFGDADQTVEAVARVAALLKK